MARSVRRPYLAAAGLGLLAAAGACLQPLAEARAMFDSQPIPANQVVALAQPLAGNRWGLVLLEQRQADIPCWQVQADGTVLSLADGLRHESFCGRYASSGAYSLRVGGNDLSRPWQLKLEARDDLIELQATSPQATQPIVVAQAPLANATPAANTLVKLDLRPGWQLERRGYNGRLLSHIYVSNSDSLPRLLAKALDATPLLLAAPPTPPPLLATATPNPSFARGRGASRSITGTRLDTPSNSSGTELEGSATLSQVIALQVVPFRD